MEYFMYRIISSVNKDTLTSSFLNCNPFVFLFCLIARTNTKGTPLNQSGNNLVLDVGEFSPPFS